MIVKMKFLSISGPKTDIDRVCDQYLSKYEMQLENAVAELKTTDNLQPFVDLNPYREPLAKAEQFTAMIKDDKICPKAVTSQEEMLAMIREVNHDFLELQEQGANNINLVTPGQYVPHIIRAVEQARRQGLAVPIVYNTGSYENVDTIKALEGIVDIYLPDFKYMDPFLAAKYSHAPDYPQTAKAAIAEMVRQQPRPVFAWEEKRGEDVPEEACEGAVMKRGVIVRQLLLPGCLKDARNIVRYLYETYQIKIYVSLMSQYTPLEHVRDYPELAHRVSRRTYDRYVDAAIALGITQAFIQEPGVAKESFIPDFSNAEGV